MRKHFLIQFCTLFVFFVFHSCTKDVGMLPAPNSVDCSKITYTQDIKPLIDTYCVGCHSSGFSSGDLVSHAEVKLKVDNGSLLKEVVTNRTMPQGTSLSEQEIQKFKCWIENGGLDN